MAHLGDTHLYVYKRQALATMLGELTALAAIQRRMADSGDYSDASAKDLREAADAAIVARAWVEKAIK